MTAGLLPCGRDADELLEQVAGGRGTDRDSHQAGCAHCAAVLGEYDRLWSPVRDAAAEPVRTPDGLLETALGRLRAPDDSRTRVDDPDGVTRVSARVVAAIARHAAEQVPGVRVALCRALPDPPSAPPPGTATAVLVTLAADHGRDLVALGADVHRSVTGTVRRLTGLVPAQVTVVVDDVFV